MDLRMITRILLLVGMVWSLCPFLPLLPFPYQAFYGLAAVCLLWTRRKPWAIYGVSLFCALGFGIGQLDRIGQNQLPPEKEGALWQGEIQVQKVRYSSAPFPAGHKYAQVQAKIIRQAPSDNSLLLSNNQLISLSWANPGELQQGQRYRISAKLQRLNSQLNPAGVDFGAFNLSQGIYLNGQVLIRAII